LRATQDHRKNERVAGQDTEDQDDVRDATEKDAKWRKKGSPLKSWVTPPSAIREEYLKKGREHRLSLITVQKSRSGWKAGREKGLWKSDGLFFSNRGSLSKKARRVTQRR